MAQFTSITRPHSHDHRCRLRGDVRRCPGSAPDVRRLMNADGDGSAVLGLVCRGLFIELSFPSTSSISRVGIVRPIRTVLYIAPDREAQQL